MKDFKQYLLSEAVDLTQFDDKLKSFVAGAQKIIDDYYTHNKLNMPTKPTLRADKGKKFVKVVTLQAHTGSQAGSVHVFIDMTNGDVLKPASWATPAKGARGNIFDAKNGLGRMGPHGPEYNR